MDPETRAFLDEMRRELSGRFDAVDRRFESMDGKIDGLADEVRRSGVLTEELRRLIQTVAENVALNNKALDRFRTDVYRDMNAGFSLVHVALGALRGDIDELRHQA